MYSVYYIEQEKCALYMHVQEYGASYFIQFLPCPAVGPKFKKATQETPQPSAPPPPPYLMHNQQALTTRSLTSLSEKSGFSQQWRTIAPHLGLSPTEVERCQGLGAGDDSEACLQMLILRSQRHHDSPLTLAALADAIEKSGCSYLYETLQSVL